MLRGHSDPIASSVYNGGRVKHSKTIFMADFESCPIGLPFRVVGIGRVRRIDNQVLHVTPGQVSTGVDKKGREQCGSGTGGADSIGME